MNGKSGVYPQSFSYSRIEPVPATTRNGKIIEAQRRVERLLQDVDFYRRMGTDVSDFSALLSVLPADKRRDVLDRIELYRGAKTITTDAQALEELRAEVVEHLFYVVANDLRS